MGLDKLHLILTSHQWSPTHFFAHPHSLLYETLRERAIAGDGFGVAEY